MLHSLPGVCLILTVDSDADCVIDSACYVGHSTLVHSSVCPGSRADVQIILALSHTIWQVIPIEEPLNCDHTHSISLTMNSDLTALVDSELRCVH